MPKRNQNLTAHFMIRDEQYTVGWALLAVAPYVKRVLFYDTGSTDKTLEIVEEVNKIVRNIEITKVEDCLDQTKWSANPEYPVSPNPPCPRLGNVRNLMTEATDTEWFIIVDGDEVWHDKGVRGVSELVSSSIDTKIDCFYVPLIWLAEDAHTQCRLANPQIYPLTGRIFRREGFECINPFPGEVGVYKGKIACAGDDNVGLFETAYPMFHYEMTFKPWRRKAVVRQPLPVPYPPVLFKYRELCGIPCPSLSAPPKGLIVEDPISGNKMRMRIPDQDTLLTSCMNRVFINDENFIKETRHSNQQEDINARAGTPAKRHHSSLEDIKYQIPLYMDFSGTYNLNITSHPLGKCVVCGVTGPLFTIHNVIQDRLCLGCVTKKREEIQLRIRGGS